MVTAAVKIIRLWSQLRRSPRRMPCANFRLCSKDDIKRRLDSITGHNARRVQQHAAPPKLKFVRCRSLKSVFAEHDNGVRKGAGKYGGCSEVPVGKPRWIAGTKRILRWHRTYEQQRRDKNRDPQAASEQ